ncbi:MAG: peptidase [Methanobrevibacter millerae]|uniref:Peptidase n=1 Tax=Methanobrevibacter millerae TaxID=230361 RepID=A0A8T3VNA0_9EURY|nr:peptidase [Methanobrevibacter millerae]MBE6506140.1 peptidase [Methanobrevibacter millerae]
MNNTKEFLKQIGIDEVDSGFVSDKRFEDGGQFRFEVPGIQSPKTMKALLNEAERQNLVIHRVTQTKGIMLLSDEEIDEMVGLAKEYGCELFLSVGPRATYDTSATVHTKEGSRIGYRLRGYDNLVYAIEDVKRAVSLGVRGILLYDEGLLYVLNQMRENDELPKSLHFKMSAHAGCGNPASAKVLESMGLNSINPVRDLQIPMLASIRNAIDIPIDLHTENPKSTGGFIRHYEVPKFIEVASPVYLKTGGSVAANHNWDTTEKEAVARIKQVKLVERMIKQYLPEAVMSPKKSSNLAIPE